MFAAGEDCDSNVMTHSHVPVKVFIAEDSAIVRDRVAALLSDREMDIVGHGETPQACIDGILAAHPDVVVLDVRLEGGTGLQVLRAVHQVEPGIGFVVFSNNAGPAYRQRYLGEGAQRFLDKTTEMDQLADAVRNTTHQAH
jgi:DNA-binding NarL/FixJ family response regulator